MKKIRCIVIDDEPKARQVIKRYIEKLDWLTFTSEFKDPLKALEFLSTEVVDLIFLDINMPGINGVEFVKTLIHKPKIIFTTAYSDYALEGYENDVMDYLLKPIRFDRFMRSMNKLREQSPSTEVAKHIIVKSGHRYHKIILAEIVYLEKDGNYLEIVQLNGQKVLLRENMGNIFEVIPESHFIRIHKSFVVSKNQIIAVEVNKVIMSGNIKIPVGASYRDVLMQYFK